ncbi:hypothetical protein [Bacteroides sp. An19]|uniref:hypothetical protein n=1 Tax=Bacteroides sp. An19 TaxID=1965580 RepID=UPI000B569F3B|nr:hypothetical protein [Bacteroides sp. An19]OUP34629.1 hypothetical protein B5F25_05285 [Bacteroides sp. An19]
MMHFKGLYFCDFTKVFDWKLSIEEIENKTRSKWERFYKLLRSLSGLILHLIYKYHTIEIHSRQDNKILFLYNPVRDRKDIMKLFLDVADTIENKQYDFIKWNIIKIFSLKRFYKMSLLCFTWGIVLLKQKYLFKQTILTLRILLEIKDKQDELEHLVNINKYQLLVVLYDAYPIDNYFSQLFKLNGIKTATLQHGVMLAPRKEIENNIDFAGLEFKNFISDYFLVWNQFTKNEAIKAGLDENKIKVLGIAKCLNSQSMEFGSKKVFGIILDGEYEKENNSIMIDIANIFAEKMNYGFIVRYHPNFKGNEYANRINNNHGKTCEKATSLIEFFNEISFCIISNSTVLFEILYWGGEVYHYSSLTPNDKFKDLNIPSFHTSDELLNLFKTRNKKATFPEICGPKNIKERYRRFFKEIVCKVV